MADFFAGAILNASIKSTAELEKITIAPIDLGEYDSNLLALAGVEALVTAFLSTSKVGYVGRLTIENVTDKTVKEVILTGIGRVRKIATGEVYEIALTIYEASNTYANLYTAITSAWGAMLNPLIYYADFREMHAENNLNIGT